MGKIFAVLQGTIVTGACLYEATAMVTGKVPTITNICSRKKWMGPTIVIGLSAHFYAYNKGVKDR
jgi:hypothetical protein